MTLALLLTFSGSMLAQAAGTASSAEAASEESTVILSPFVVSSEGDSGYRATDTLSGTRIRTDLADIGSAISVLTREFLQDVGGFDNETVLAYALNADVGGARGNFMGSYQSGANTNEDGLFANPNGNNRIRGLDSADNTRNFFLTEIPWDGYNTDRVDIQRGPNAMLFGVGRPAGVINATTIDARFDRNAGEIQNRLDKFGSVRLQGDYNHVLIKDQLAVRGAFIVDRENFRREPAFENDDRYFLTAKYRPAFLNRKDVRVELSANYEQGSIESNRPRFLTPGDSFSRFFLPTEQGGTGGQIVDFRVAGAGTAQVGGRTINANHYANIGEPGPVLAFGSLPLTDGSAFDYWLPANARGQSPFNFNGLVSAQPVFGSTLVTYSPLTRQQVVARANAAQGTTEEEILWSGLGRILNDRITNPDVFDFYNHMFEGDSKREFRDWDAFDVSLTNTYFKDRLGFNLAYHRENVDFYRYAFLGFDKNEIRIDMAATLTDLDVVGGQAVATPNPNVGRAYIQHQLANGTSSTDARRDSFRAQVFGEYDFRANNRSGFWNRLLGKHRFTGLYDAQSLQDFSRNTLSPASFGPEYMARVFPNNAVFDNNQARPVVRIYVSDDLRGVTSPDEVRLGRVEGNIFEMLSGQPTMRYFDETWTLPTGPTAGSSAWTTPDGNTIGNAGQRQNPANYAGWTTASFPLYTILDPDRIVEGAPIEGLTARDYLTRSARLTEDKVKSHVLSWQGYLWNDSIVGTYGWREDDVSRYRVTSGRRPAGGPYNRPEEGADLRPEFFRYGMTEAPPRGGTLNFTDPAPTQSTNWSVTAHVNRLLGERDFLPFRVSLYYNEGENVDPFSNVNLDIYGNTLPLAQGTTRDTSVLLATKDNKYSVRITDYKSTVKNRTSTALQQAFNIQQSLEAGAEREYQYRRFGETDGAEGIDPNLVPDPARLNNVIRPAWRQFAQDMEAEFPWLIERMFSNGSIVNATDTITVSGFPEAATIEDTVSEGLEFEFTANPTPNWRIAINASKTEAKRDNAPGPTFQELMDFLDHAFTNTPVGEMTFAQGDGTSINTSTIWNDRWSGYRGQYLRLLALNGQLQPEIREWRYTLVTNYTFKEGRFRGLGVGGAFRYEDPVTVSYPLLPLDSDGDGVTDDYAAFDVSRPYQGSSEQTVDLWTSYETKLTDKIRWRIQLNVYNVFGQNELIPLNMEPDGTAREFRIKEGLSWALTNTFKF